MALATQCPHCRTTFRVAHDQLKLRAGLVRCGSCKQIFNGIEHLLPSDAAAATRTPAPAASTDALKPVAAAASAAPSVANSPAPAPDAPSQTSAQTNVPQNAPAASSALDFAYPEPEPEPQAIPDTVVEPKPDEPIEVEFIEVPRKSPLPAAAAAEPATARDAAPNDEHNDAAASDPLQRMTLVDLSEEQAQAEPHPDDAAAASPGDMPDPLDQVMEEFERKPPRGKKKVRPHVRSPLVTMQQEVPAAPQEAPAPAPVPDESLSEAEEPEFIKRERKKQTRGRSMRIAMGVGSCVLFVTALLQAAYSFRDQLAARIPESKPLLQDACDYLGCKINLPAQIDSLSIEAPQIAMLATRKDTSELSLLMRNSGSTVQSWPQLDMTLSDENNNPLARRVFSPREYLPASIDPQKGFAAGSEQPIKVYFEFADAKPANYHVDVFYR